VIETKRRTAVDDILNRAATTDSTPHVEGRDAFQEARTRSRDCVMLDVRLASGAVESFNYAYLVRVSYKPGDRLRLQFGNTAVQIEGRRLARLREMVAEHRCSAISEGTDAEEGLKPEDAPHIESIEIIQESEEPL
jgi:hypothetical protein